MSEGAKLVVHTTWLLVVGNITAVLFTLWLEYFVDVDRWHAYLAMLIIVNLLAGFGGVILACLDWTPSKRKE